MLPIEIARSEKLAINESEQIVLELRVDRNLFWFNGHFSHQPILPGVAQLDWVMHYGAEILVPEGYSFSAIENIKFQRPVLPRDRLRLTLLWHASKQQLSFTFHILDVDEERVASSGKIKLIDDSVVTLCP